MKGSLFKRNRFVSGSEIKFLTFIDVVCNKMGVFADRENSSTTRVRLAELTDVPLPYPCTRLNYLKPRVRLILFALKKIKNLKIIVN